MAIVSDLSRGSLVRYHGEVAKVETIEHRTPGNLRAFYQIKMRNLRTGKIIENRFRPSDTIDLLRVETKPYQYLYAEGNHLICMDIHTFEQIYVDKSFLGHALKYLKENVELSIIFENEDTPILVECPAQVILHVTYTEPGVMGDTATRATKLATVETGAEIKVPLFIEVGNCIKIDTTTGTYIERIK